MNNVFTVDTEDWFHANYEEGLFKNDASIRSTVEQNTEVYLERFAQAGATATFFVLGFVAEQHPELVRKIAAAGHEIASHGYAHQLVYNQTPKAFREDIRHSKLLLEDIIGQQVVGYRAPSWSITKKSLWALAILEEEGFRFDSSIFPFQNFLYGIDKAPRFPFPASHYNPQAKNLLEIPPSTISVAKKNIPFSGGFYFRAAPYMFIHGCGKKINAEGHPIVFYLHPREIDPLQPRLKLNKRDAFIHYYGIKSCEKKFAKVLRDFQCVSISKLSIF